MMKLLTASATAAVLALALAPADAHACDGNNKTAKVEKKAGPGELSAEQLNKLMVDKKSKVTVLDVNSEDTRKSHGTIPGAVLLTSYKDYAMSELPQDKESKLVFYCASTRCGASKKAAKRALGEGYTDVAVLPVGIKGWAAEGFSVAGKNVKKTGEKAAKKNS